MIRAASRHATADLREHLEQAADGMSGDELTALADELYAVAGLLVVQPQLRRTVGDPSTDPDSRAALLSALFGNRVGARALSVVQFAARQRWSSPWDLTDALELAGDDVLMRVAESQQALDDVEDELFRFERILDAEVELTTLFDDVAVGVPRRVALLRDLLAAKVHPVTEALLEHAVESTRKRSFLLAVDDLLQATATRRDRSIARVTSAVMLTDAQEERLAAALSRIYGRAIRDPERYRGLRIVLHAGGHA